MNDVTVILDAIFQRLVHPAWDARLGYCPSLYLPKWLNWIIPHTLLHEADFLIGNPLRRLPENLGNFPPISARILTN